MTDTALVITSISAPNPALRACAEGCLRHGIDFFVVGDTKSPADFSLGGCQFLSLDSQRRMPLRIASLLPERHYARKNLGYLAAMARGAHTIIETDDDNFPRESFWLEKGRVHRVPLVRDGGWVNVYRYFTDAMIWPRGFPLEEIQAPVPDLQTSAQREIVCPIQQGLADDNPDVDAIYRLTRELPQRFDAAAQVAIGEGSWTSFNSQNTTWFREAFPLLYIPSYCSFRMCDIWRSFIAQRICWANGWGVLFHGPTVYQERNEHDLLRDFKDEVPGYLNNVKICKALAGLELATGDSHMPDNLRSCYRAFVELGLIGEEEMPLLDAWLEALASLGQAGKGQGRD
ncbi:STELLO glycosyltransferase family protein [Geomonas oryzae]|uniref:STELLO glycosyltransferase family protein n=1 Tax=Geomonas oryzae TaxID=2364273 RepID=UPI00100AB4A9|nr:STELLO glycosyltransferase family protein [Geomonas oryzae]